MANFLTVQAQKFKLSGAGVTAVATTIILQSFKTPAGTNILTADFGAIGYLTIDPGTSKEEVISFTTVTQNADGTATLTGVTRGLGFTSAYAETTANKLSHAGGSIAVLSNPAAFYNKFPAKANDEVITGQWQVPAPLAGGNVVNKTYADALAMSGTGVTNAAIVVAGAAGETVAAGQIVYLKAADGRWWLADADLTATIDGVQLGVAQGAGTAGNNITGGVLLRGVDSNQSGLTVGTKYYISNTAGAISSSVGTLTRTIGNAKSATALYFDAFFGENPTGNEKAAMAGGGSLGTPSTSNKFQTETGVTTAITAVQKFGGTGADGALTITSGATNIDLLGAAVVTKNYTSISITGTGSLTFTNPHANGTTIILKSQGAVTLTSSTAPMINCQGLGASGGLGADNASGDGINGLDGTEGTDGKSAGSFYKTNKGGQKTGGDVQTPGVGGAIASFDALKFTSQFLAKYPNVIPGAGGGGAGSDKSAGSGSSVAGDGGRGGGALIIECRGAFNFTTAGGISVAGNNGGDATSSLGSSTTIFAGGGGGGGGGTAFIFYGSLIANSGTITVSGGIGGNTSNSGNVNSAAGAGGAGSASAAGTTGTTASGTSKSGGDGAAGISLVASNTEFT